MAPSYKPHSRRDTTAHRSCYKLPHTRVFEAPNPGFTYNSKRLAIMVLAMVSPGARTSERVYQVCRLSHLP